MAGINTSGDSPCPRCHQYRCVCGDVLASVIHNNSPWNDNPFPYHDLTTKIDSHTWDKALEVAADLCEKMIPEPNAENSDLLYNWLMTAAKNIRNKKLNID